jgi:nitrite reductase (NO-forming)
MSAPTPRLSDLVRQLTSRRAFLTRASALAAALPGAGAALTACAGPVPNRSSQAGDSAAGRSPSTAGAATAAPSVPIRWYDPALPPLGTGRTHEVHVAVQEVPIRITDDTVVAAWTFGGTVPGPILHVRQGDTIDFTLTNHGSIPHSMDFHSARIDPKTAFRGALPGESVSFTFQPRYAGAFLYHCYTAPMVQHVGSGMCGAMIVDPPTPLAPAREFVFVQNEYYLGVPKNGIYPLDYFKMLAALPDYVSFNGVPSQYQRRPVHVRRNDRVRFYVVAAGPNHPCSFHVVGQQFDTVYLGAPPGSAIHGAQTFMVPPGGGMVFEFVADVTGEFPFVTHTFGQAEKGAIGTLVVE